MITTVNMYQICIYVMLSMSAARPLLLLAKAWARNGPNTVGATVGVTSSRLEQDIRIDVVRTSTYLQVPLRTKASRFHKAVRGPAS
jgi:hypothetical protein